MADVLSSAEERDEQRLPDLKDGEIGVVTKIDILSKRTRPPARYTEGTLVADMEAAGKYLTDPKLKQILKKTSGLGTGATRAAIIEELKTQKLLEARGRYIVATEKGRALIAFLPPVLYDIATTAHWEARLDHIAQGADSSLFDRDIIAQVREHIETLRLLKGMQRGTTVTTTNSKGARSMSNENKRANKPTDKMLGYAKKIAAALGKPLPKEVSQDFDACREFIDAHKDTPFPPSEKALNFAKSIAEQKGLELPDSVQRSARELSQWIDANK